MFFGQNFKCKKGGGGGAFFWSKFQGQWTILFFTFKKNWDTYKWQNQAFFENWIINGKESHFFSKKIETDISGKNKHFLKNDLSMVWSPFFFILCCPNLMRISKGKLTVSWVTIYLCDGFESIVLSVTEASMCLSNMASRGSCDVCLVIATLSKDTNAELDKNTPILASQIWHLECRRTS